MKLSKTSREVSKIIPNISVYSCHGLKDVSFLWLGIANSSDDKIPDFLLVTGKHFALHH